MDHECDQVDTLYGIFRLICYESFLLDTAELDSVLTNDYEFGWVLYTLVTYYHFSSEYETYVCLIYGYET